MQHAITSQPRPMRAFHVSLRSPVQRLAFTALAKTSGDALCNALAIPGLPLPVCASVKPVGTPGDALRLYRRKLALSDLVG